MAATLGNAIGGGIDLLVRTVVIPATSVVPILVRTGLLFAGFALLWLACIAALVVDPAALDAVWRSLTSLPLLLQAVVWLLFLPLTAGLWIWQTDWPAIVRVVLIISLAAWNLLVFLPRREPAAVAAVDR